MTLAPVDAATEAVLLPIAEAAYGLEEKTRGAIFTRQSVVDFMLDLIGYTPDRPLHQMAILEPSFGGGRFVLSAVDRLLESWRTARGINAEDLVDALRCVELDTDTVNRFRPVLRSHLVSSGLSESDAEMLVSAWIKHEDFLLAGFDRDFDFVVGNPPYVRQELIPDDLLRVYRSTYPTMVGRADLYIAFMERSLDLLRTGGRLSFICADAWVKNDYGRGIRAKIANEFHLAYYVDMYGLDAFEVQVGAYPSITVIERSTAGPVEVARATSVAANYLDGLAESLKSGQIDRPDVIVLNAVRGPAPWLLSTSASLAIISDLESRFPTLVETGCRVGIGVATGADKAYIGPFESLDVEADRKLPLATNKDVPGGRLVWSGKGVVNPWRDEGGLVDLAEYPKLAAHLEQFREQLERRHTAKNDTKRKWYRTIDRITPSLTYEPKLLIPDIKGNGDAIAFDPGTLYPHHNLYFITSESWNLRALQALLRTGIAHMFVAAYSVKIGGGYLRFQAQNLKRIRVPLWESIAPMDQSEMIRAGEAGEKLSTSLLERIYQLQDGTLAFLGEN
ncbi:Eco57I restriction-modification methylase domain-containing protein [Microbacterium sp. zg-Y818]|uniref:Eco57I restriction-modification methylase domain-containing protein n=1 Tax=unclassified Microbacterium TaxID=2609290 RepID=UPI00214CBC5B|nr:MULTISPECIES: Eco57I restriction-modification methylase domain-containing protein [unclassified Microbacterium]MCR2799489.1 Eco57I restriction-modification methylase domain-containing protein [Microbacterium sp. zg.Y818]WIM21486.1 Eco57I restriction-modification methylase domain-containing protein [Microbacterium sp. zg-Y818]